MHLVINQCILLSCCDPKFRFHYGDILHKMDQCSVNLIANVVTASNYGILENAEERNTETTE